MRTTLVLNAAFGGGALTAAAGGRWDVFAPLLAAQVGLLAGYLLGLGQAAAESEGGAR